MSDTPSRNDPDKGISIGAGPDAGLEQEQPARRKRRGLRIALVTAASFVVLIGAVAAGGYAYVNHLASSIQRIPVTFAKLDAARGSSEYGGAMTVLITGKGIGPTGAMIGARGLQQRADHAAARQRLRLLGRRGVHPAAVHRAGSGARPDANSRTR